MSDEILQIKNDILSEIKSNRKSWNFTEIPQIIVLFVFVLGLTFLTAFGLYISISAIKSGSTGDSASIMESIKFYVTGSSSLLGFIVSKLMVRLSEVTKGYLKELKVFSGTISMINTASTKDELIEYMKDYYKR